MVLGQECSSRFSEERITTMVELTIWEGELFGMLMSFELDADWNLSLAKAPLPPTSLQFRGGNGDYTVCLSCGETEMSTPAR